MQSHSSNWSAISDISHNRLVKSGGVVPFSSGAHDLVSRVSRESSRTTGTSLIVSLPSCRPSLQVVWCYDFTRHSTCATHGFHEHSFACFNAGQRFSNCMSWQSFRNQADTIPFPNTKRGLISLFFISAD